jgi:hypothetical protein
VVKPHWSGVRVNGIWQSTAVAYADNETGLEAILAAKNPIESPILLQQRIVRPRVSEFMCYQRIKVVGWSRSSANGVFVKGRSECASVPSDARGYAEGLPDALQWGAMVEFRNGLAD